MPTGNLHDALAERVHVVRATGETAAVQYAGIAVGPRAVRARPT